MFTPCRMPAIQNSFHHTAYLPGAQAIHTRLKTIAEILNTHKNCLKHPKNYLSLHGFCSLFHGAMAPACCLIRGSRFDLATFQDLDVLNILRL